MLIQKSFISDLHPQIIKGNTYVFKFYKSKRINVHHIGYTHSDSNIHDNNLLTEMGCQSAATPSSKFS